MAIRERGHGRAGEDDGPTTPTSAQPSTSRRLEQVGLPIALGAIYAGLAWRYGWSSHRAELVLGCIYTALLFEIAIIDFHSRLVLNVLSLPAAAIGFAGSGVWSGIGFGSSLLAGFVALALFVVIEIVGRGAMGRGDTKLAGTIGFMRGFPTVFQAIFAGILIGGLMAVALLVSGRGRRSTFAYGPALAMGAVLSMFLTLR